MSHAAPPPIRPMSFFRRPQSLRWRLLIMLGIVLMALLVGIGVGVYYFVFRTEQAAWQDRQSEAARYAGETVAAFTQRVTDILVLVSLQDRSDLAANPDVMRGLVQHEPALLELIRLDANGRVVDSAYQDAAVLANQFTIPQSTWFAAARSGQFYAGSVQISSANEPYLIMAVPAPDGGVVAARLRMSVLWDVVDDVRFGATGSAFVIDQRQRIIAHTDPEVVLANPTLEQWPELIAMLQSPTTFSGGYVSLDGQPVVGAAAPVPGTDWVVVTELAQAEAFATGRLALGILGGGTIVLGALVMAATGLVLGHLIFRRLATLQAGAVRLGRGDLSHRLAVPRQDELGEVASAFNRMADELQGVHGELESLVAARTEQLRASADVGRAAASILDTDNLLREVVNLITNRFGFYYVAVFTLDEHGKYAVLREATGEAGRLLKERGHKLDVGARSMVGYVTAQRKPRIALDVADEPMRFANPLLPDTRSEIALPLIVGDRILGALDVQSTREAAFDEASAAVLQGMADQIAIALNNAEHFHRAEQQAKTLAVLNQLSRELAMAASLDEIDRAATTALVSLVTVDGVVLGLTMSNPETVKLVPLYLQTIERQPIPSTLPGAQTLIGHCIRVGHTVHFPDLGKVADSYLDVAAVRNAGVRSLAGVPLRVGSDTVGALFVGAARIDAYTSGDIGHIEQVAAQLAVAIGNLNRAEETRQALAELDAVNRRLTGEAWSAFARRLSRQGVTWAGSGPKEKWQSPEVEEAISAKRIIVRPATGAGNYNIAVPILLRGIPLGAFRLSIPKYSWSDELAIALDSIAGHVAQAVENARLVEEAGERAARERALAEATDKIRSKADMERILQTAAEELARYLSAVQVAVRLGAVGDVVPGNGHEPPIAKHQEVNDV